MKIIISGGLGYVGGRLSKYFAEDGHTVVALSRQANALAGQQWPAGMTVKHPDEYVLQPHLLKGFDVFIHLAALNEHDCVKYPEKAIEINITQTWQWLDRAYQAGIRQFVYFSTAHVYGKPLEGYYNEQSLPKPVHPYAITHKCAEDYVLSYREEKGMNNLVIRLTNSFGGPAFPTADRWTLLVNDLCRSAVETGTMTLLSDGTQLRDFVCLEDVTHAVNHHLLLNNHENGIYNLGAGHSTSIWDMALLVQKKAELVLQKSIQLTRKEPASPAVPASLQISIQKLLQTGFSPATQVGDEIESTLRYFINHPV
jgi:UDP-glucose 4-epimerase